MGNPNELHFVDVRRSQYEGPYLEIGSHNYGSTQNLRSVMNVQDYTGVDMIDGPGVDKVVDLIRPFEEVDAKLEGKRFGTIFCFCVLEHCAQPFFMAENMTRLLKPGGKVVLSAPYAWQFHGYPSDYWRFTHEGVRTLFPRLNFDLKEGLLYHPPKGMTMPIDEKLDNQFLSAGRQFKAGHPFAGAFIGLLKALGPLNPLRHLMSVRYLMMPSTLIMVGQAPAQGDTPPDAAKA